VKNTRGAAEKKRQRQGRETQLRKTGQTKERTQKGEEKTETAEQEKREEKREKKRKGKNLKFKGSLPNSGVSPKLLLPYSK